MSKNNKFKRFLALILILVYIYMWGNQSLMFYHTFCNIAHAQEQEGEEPLQEGEQPLQEEEEPLQEEEEPLQEEEQLLQVLQEEEEQILPARFLIIHSSTSTKMTNDAAHNIMNLINPTIDGYNPDDPSTWPVNFDVRTTTQIAQTSSNELKSLIEEADIVIAEWMFEPGFSHFRNVISANPGITINKPHKIFIVLESYLELTRLSQIDGQLLFEGVPDSVIGDTSKKDTILFDLKNANFNRLNNYKTTYPQISDWIDAGSYFAAKGTVNYENQYKWALNKYTELNGHTWPLEWNPEPYFIPPKEMLYRDGKIFTNLDEYFEQYPLDPLKPTVGIVEYDSPVLAGNMDHFETMIDELTAKGLNVMPVAGAYSGTVGNNPLNIYSAMVKFFTDAPSTTAYEANPQNYPSKIDALVSFYYFSLGSGFLAQTNRFLDNINVPVFRAMTSTKRTEGEWLVSDDGLLWSDTYYQIAIPETQGIIEPIFVATTEKETDSVTGAELSSYKAIPDRIEKLANRVNNWIKLRTLNNADKKIALVYYNYPPGKQNIGASYLAVPDSIMEILERLKREGYTVDEIPETADELLNIMFERGVNVANWAPGVLEELADKAILWEVEQYEAWFEKLHPIAKKQVVEGPVGYIEEITKVGVKYGAADETVKAAAVKTIEKWTQEMISLVNTYPEKSQQAIAQVEKMSRALIDVMEGEDAWSSFYEAKDAFLKLAIPGITGWGELPGNVMTVTKGGKEYIVIPGMYFGNIFVGPEPQRGWEADAGKFYHSTVVPPHHQYLAWYAWVNEVFKANAQLHIGRHATYEWLPRKQVALASFDYSDIMIADTPSVYIYIVDGVGEGLQAKRRGLAVIVDHLTPPLKTTALYGGFLELKGLIEDYDKASAANNPVLMEAYAGAVRSKVKELNLGTDLGINPDDLSDEELVEEVCEYLKNLLQTLMPYGLHTFGRLWTDDEIALLATSMVSADSGAESPSLQRLLALENGWDFDNLTLAQAEQLNNQAQDWVLQLITGQKTASDLTSDERLQKKLNEAKGYADKIRASFGSELDALVDALNGGYVTPSTGNDPIRNPGAIPTGKNFYGISEQLLPTRVAWDLGKKLADMALSQLDAIPEKIAAVVWCVETARDDGTMVSFVLRMLGVEPQPTAAWLGGGSTGRMIATPLNTLLSDLNKIRASKGLSPLTERPRIDVVVTTSGLFRDLFPRTLINMDRSFLVALAASYDTIVAGYPSLQPSLDYALQTLVDAKYTGFKGKEPIELNFIAKHWIELTQKYIDLGIPADNAGELAITRIFAPPVGDYGAGVSKAVEQSWTWETRDQVADVYLMRMSHSYSERGWGNPNLDLFKDLLSGITVTYHSRSTNLYGVLDNDDYFDYYGGLSMAIERVNGAAPNLNVLHYANPANSIIMSLQGFMVRELRTRYYNPEWIQGMMNEGYSGARTISNKFVNYLWGWQVTNPNIVQDWMWQEVVDIYLNDKDDLGVNTWLSTGNRGYSLIEITGTLLTTAHKNFWNADEITLQQVADTWAKAIIQHGVSCGITGCGNHEMFKWAVNYIDPDLLPLLNDIIMRATNRTVLTPEELARLLPQEQPDTPQADSDTAQTESGMTVPEITPPITGSTDQLTKPEEQVTVPPDKPQQSPLPEKPANEISLPGTRTSTSTQKNEPRPGGQTQVNLPEREEQPVTSVDSAGQKLTEEKQQEQPRSSEDIKAYELAMEERDASGTSRAAVVFISAVLGLALLGLTVGGYYKKKTYDKRQL
ncbi:MAG: hypothetical protein CVU88_03000 [Firmicutes bacterium HGW-Firmicutes-13]|nr:MAG: hypothetical protein CVU88_03000 [Firmicutes bacterium HGW-Firmicutes-13]